MNAPSPRERARQNATGIVSVVVTGTWIAALLLGFEWWLALMLVGYVVIVPVFAMLFDDTKDGELRTDDDRSDSTDPVEPGHEGENNADALERLRTRYANGELTDDQFERKLDRLLETETPESAEEWRRRERERGSEGAVEREREER